MSQNLRIRWEVDPVIDSKPKEDFSDNEKKQLESLGNIYQILRGKHLTTYYQPIFSMQTGSIFGFEALTRLEDTAPFETLESMFLTAQATGSLSALDTHCMATALKCLNIPRFLDSSALLFLNTCPETLMNMDISFEIVSDTLHRLSIPPERIILEITEESVISNYDLFRNSLNNLRMLGLRIAIDDFGSGYAGLKMLSTIEPDFLKIDRHFIADIDRAIIKYNLVDAIATACNRIGIHIVAEGIERQEELEIIQDLGIEFLQGFALGRPAPTLEFLSKMPLHLRPSAPAKLESSSDRCFLGDIASSVQSLNPSSNAEVALHCFLENDGLSAIPVVVNKKVVGVLERNRFFEDQALKASYGQTAENSISCIGEIMEQEFFSLDIHCTLEEASQKISKKFGKVSKESLVVLKHGYYYGMAETHRLLDALREQSILLARDANPLSGLPGNNTIQREISRRLAQNMHFDVLYIDIDHFKPFNDYYGFARGDHVIVELAAIIRQTLAHYNSTFNFAGHIGGDDFIVITRPTVSLSAAQAIIQEFSNKLTDFHDKKDFTINRFLSRSREGKMEHFDLLSLSIGIVSTEVFNISSYSQLASIACEIKKAAKLQRGSSIARDRRLFG